MRIIIALLLLGFIIMFHEFGHFLFARLNHITVNEFAIGMGPKLFSKKRGDTTYSIRLLPFGGFCAMQDEDSDGEYEPDQRDDHQQVDDANGAEHTDTVDSVDNPVITEVKKGSKSKENRIKLGFNDVSVPARISVAIAGSLFNLILALIAGLIVTAFAGAAVPRVMEVQADSPVAAAGLQEGDVIVSYEGNHISSSDELYVDLTLDSVPTDEISLIVNRDGEKITLSYKPETTSDYKIGFSYSQTDEPAQLISVTDQSPAQQAGIQMGDIIVAIDGVDIASGIEMQQYFAEHPLDGQTVHLTVQRGNHNYEAAVVPQVTELAELGFAFSLGREKVSLPQTIKYAFGQLEYNLHVTWKSLAGLISGRFSVNQMSGPVGVVKTVGEVYESASAISVGAVVLTLLNMLVLISTNLGFVNLLPLPGLDGGRVISLLFEGITKKHNRELEAKINFVGLMLLLGFSLYITFQDVFKIFF